MAVAAESGRHCSCHLLRGRRNEPGRSAHALAAARRSPLVIFSEAGFDQDVNSGSDCGLAAGGGSAAESSAGDGLAASESREQAPGFGREAHDEPRLRRLETGMEKYLGW